MRERGTPKPRRGGLAVLITWAFLLAAADGADAIERFRIVQVPDLGFGGTVRGFNPVPGATTGQILALFLGEAALLALAGGVAGVALGLGSGALLRAFLPGLPFHTPPEFMAAAIALSTAIGLASGALPARRAARLDPVMALRAE